MTPLSPQAIELLWALFGPKSTAQMPVSAAPVILELQQWIQAQVPAK